LVARPQHHGRLSEHHCHWGRLGIDAGDPPLERREAEGEEGAVFFFLATFYFSVCVRVLAWHRQKKKKKKKKKRKRKKSNATNLVLVHTYRPQEAGGGSIEFRSGSLCSV
jgi:hypothetical protein